MPRQKVPDAIRELKEQVKYLKKQIPKKPFGRPEVFDENQKGILERACGFPGIKEEQVAWIMNVHPDTILKYIKRKYGMTFTEFRAQKKADIQLRILNAQLELGVNDKNCTMLIWLGKIHCDQREKSETILSNGNGVPFQLVINEPKD